LVKQLIQYQLKDINMTPAQIILKHAFVSMTPDQQQAQATGPGGMAVPGAQPGGAPLDPMAAGGGMPPMDPAAGGMPPPTDPMAAGGMPPMDPAASGMPAAPLDPMAAGGMPPADPSAGAPMDPASMGMSPEGAGGEGSVTSKDADIVLGIVQKTLDLVDFKKNKPKAEGAAPAAPEAALPQGQPGPVTGSPGFDPASISGPLKLGQVLTRSFDKLNKPPVKSTAKSTVSKVLSRGK
jgi:hypothetical protein